MAMNLEGNLDLERKFWLRKWMAPQILESGIELAISPQITDWVQEYCLQPWRSRQGDRLSPLVGKRRNEGGHSKSGWRVHGVA